MKKLLLTMALSLAALSANAQHLGENYATVCRIFGIKGQATTWPTWPKSIQHWVWWPPMSPQSSETFCSFHNNRVEAVVFRRTY
jgi:hypothetical protein